MRIIETHKQTFHATTATSSQQFSFTRVYKTNERQKFLITVGSIGWKTVMDTNNFSPPLFYLDGLFQGHCLTQSEDGITNGGWYLGGDGYNDISTSKSHVTNHAPNTMLVSEIPLQPFRIHLDGTDYPSAFIVSFNIDIIEE